MAQRIAVAPVPLQQLAMLHAGQREHQLQVDAPWKIQLGGVEFLQRDDQVLKPGGQSGLIVVGAGWQPVGGIADAGSQRGIGMVAQPDGEEIAGQLIKGPGRGPGTGCGQAENRKKSGQDFRWKNQIVRFSAAGCIFF